MALLDERQILVEHDAHFIGGAWVPAERPRAIEVVDPTTEQVMGHVPSGTGREIDDAVLAAQHALPSWSERPLRERADLLRRVSATIERHADELATTISREVGCPLPRARAVQVGVPALTFASTAEVVARVAFEEPVDGALVRREPIGVVGAITPWNFPLHQIALKLAPALVVGCTVVLKPSEVAPLAAYRLIQLMDAAGLPPGVVNMVCGEGEVVGEALARHPGVRMVTFTGSTTAGRRVSQLAAGTVKRVTLELGGKGALLVLEDVDGPLLEEAVSDAVARCFNNSGQACSALTRLVVPRRSLAVAETMACRLAAAHRLGDPLVPGTTLGPVVSAAQRDRVVGYIERGEAEGARLIFGGARRPDDLPVGFFVRPTIFSDVRPGMSIADEEIFGPVLSIIPYDVEAEALAIVNATNYGLTSSVWSADVARGARMARFVQAGMVDVNGGSGHHLELPFGGVKQSGNGREFGTFGIEEFLELKALNVRDVRTLP